MFKYLAPALAGYTMAVQVEREGGLKDAVRAMGLIDVAPPTADRLKDLSKYRPEQVMQGMACQKLQRQMDAAHKVVKAKGGADEALATLDKAFAAHKIGDIKDYFENTMAPAALKAADAAGVDARAAAEVELLLTDIDINVCQDGVAAYGAGLGRLGELLNDQGEHVRKAVGDKNWKRFVGELNEEGTAMIRVFKTLSKHRGNKLAQTADFYHHAFSQLEEEESELFWGSVSSWASDAASTVSGGISSAASTVASHAHHVTQYIPHNIRSLFNWW